MTAMDGSTLRRVDHASDSGRWALLRLTPPDSLRSFVREIQGYSEEGGLPVLRKELPIGGVPMILVLGSGFTLHDRHRTEQFRPLRRSFVAGLHEVYALVGSAGQALCMQVNFTPLGARRFFGAELEDLAGQVLDVNSVIGVAVDRLEERLAECPDWETRFAVLLRALAERLLRPAPERALVGAALAAIENSGGDIRIAELARSLDCSRKHLTTTFRRAVGLPPKVFARVLRFERAVQGLQRREYSSLAELAADCGYADQAHFNRDFADFAGECPSRLLARMLPDGTGVLVEPR